MKTFCNLGLSNGESRVFFVTAQLHEALVAPNGVLEQIEKHLTAAETAPLGAKQEKDLQKKKAVRLIWPGLFLWWDQWVECLIVPLHLAIVFFTPALASKSLMPLQVTEK